jgi:hypothetical protein
VGVWACGRVGVWACGRVGVSACRRVGVWACGRSRNVSEALLTANEFIDSAGLVEHDADTPIRRHAPLRCDHDDDDDLAVSPVRTTDEKGTSLAYFCLDFHDLFSPFHERQFYQVPPVGSGRGARQHHPDVAGRDEQILGLAFHRDLALGN